MEKIWPLVFAVALVTVPLPADASSLHRDVVTMFKSTDDTVSTSRTLSSFTCETCKVIFKLVRDLFDKGFVRDEIIKLTIDLCKTLEIEDDTVCEGIIPLFKVSYNSSVAVNTCFSSKLT